MWFKALLALWLAATAWAAVERDDEGNIRSINVSLPFALLPRILHMGGPAPRAVVQLLIQMSLPIYSSAPTP